MICVNPYTSIQYGRLLILEWEYPLYDYLYAVLGVRRGTANNKRGAEMAASQTTKQWLYSIRAIGRRKKSIVCEISSIKEERESIYDTTHAIYGVESSAPGSSRISDPTFRKAMRLCEDLQSRLDELLFEYERLGLEFNQARDRINKCFEEGNITVQEYEVIFYYYFEGKTNEEVAEAMIYSIQSVFRLKKDATKKIHDLLRE